MGLFARISAAMGLLMLLSSCYLSPGKFVSTLDIRADRSFTFTYKGEVLFADFGNDLMKGMKDKADPADEPFEGEDAPPAEQEAYFMQIAAGKKAPPPVEAAPPPADEEGDKKAKMQAIAEALAKERGFRSVRYLGGGKFEVDYAISSRLDHGFIFPFNVDAQAVLPFFVIELRGEDKVRVQAPGLASDSDKSGAGSMGMGGSDVAKAREGTFTLTTNAEILSQNQEDGPTDTPQGKRIAWKITPLTKIAPMATLRFPAK